jgi:ribosomal-protein-alanine N-acetyltransferase
VGTQIAIEAMRLEHIPAVSAIEQRCFTQPWPANAYRKEIQTNRMAHYFIARRVDEQVAYPKVVAGRQLVATPSAAGDGILGRLTRLIRGTQESPPMTASPAELGSIVGYAGLWLMTDEAHITTIAVDPNFQGHGIGELLLLGLIDRAEQIGARWLTLEVRVSNQVAQSLYRKYTFKEMGIRRRYYSDDGEDALVMWTDPIDSDQFREAVRVNREKLSQRLGEHV